MYNVLDFIKRKLYNFFQNRIAVIIVLFCITSTILVHRLFVLQIVNGQEYFDNYKLQIQKTKEVEGTRGNIYDCNGVPLAYNELTYSVTVLDNGAYPTGYSKNKMLLRLIRLLEEHEVTLVGDTPLAVLEDDSIVFTTTSEAKHRAFYEIFMAFVLPAYWTLKMKMVS